MKKEVSPPWYSELGKCSSKSSKGDSRRSFVPSGHQMQNSIVKRLGSLREALLQKVLGVEASCSALTPCAAMSHMSAGMRRSVIHVPTDAKKR